MQDGGNSRRRASSPSCDGRSSAPPRRLTGAPIRGGCVTGMGPFRDDAGSAWTPLVGRAVLNQSVGSAGRS
ncbi:hypothetical protein FM103_19130 [Corynebacterium xerosis]|nr:hypothetical protein FM103_19130 [Corynebacterium xerosis]